MKLNPNEVKFSKQSTGDDVGKVFYWRDEICRGIYANKVAEIRELFNSGLIRALEDARLIPQSEVTNYTLDGFGLVVRHEKVNTVTYPYEWSFEMLRDAALTVLKVNSIAMKYGYQTKDCHAFNILFVGTQPVYVDLGSFVKTNSKKWICYDEFLRSYQHLLYLAETNEYHWVKQLNATDSLITHRSIFLYRYPILRRLSTNTVKKVVALWRFLKLGDDSWNSAIRRKLGFIGSLIVWMQRKAIFPFREMTLEKVEKRIASARKLNYKTIWGDYQNNFEEDNPRFNRIIEIISGYNIRTAFEAAGNQGFFSALLLSKGNLQTVFCSDYDENAIDAMYRRYRGNQNLSPVLMSFLFQNQTSFTRAADERFKSDLVVALAISHHVLLTQKQDIDFFFQTLMHYTHQYILVEFMPMGLWDSVSNTAPPVPDWYNFDWFKSHFTKYFDVITTEEVAKNRILFFGSIIRQ